MSNSLDQDQARHFVEPDLGPNCLQKLSADDTSMQKLRPFHIYVKMKPYTKTKLIFIVFHSLHTVKPDCKTATLKETKISFQDQLSLNAGQKYCRLLQGEHFAILLTFIKLPFVIKIFVLSIFEWPFYTGFTVLFTYEPFPQTLLSGSSSTTF